MKKSYHCSVLSDPGQFVSRVFFSDLNHEQRLNEINQLISKQKAFIKSEMVKLKDINHASRKLNWHEGDPMTQLTSSVNPIFESAEEWYGSFYLN